MFKNIIPLKLDDHQTDPTQMPPNQTTEAKDSPQF